MDVQDYLLCVSLTTECGGGVTYGRGMRLVLMESRCRLLLGLGSACRGLLGVPC